MKIKSLSWGGHRDSFYKQLVDAGRRPVSQSSITFQWYTNLDIKINIIVCLNQIIYRLNQIINENKPYNLCLCTFKLHFIIKFQREKFNNEM